MDYLQNHCFCTESNWDGVFYSCRHVVGLNCYEEHNKEDWENLIDEQAESFVDERMKKISEKVCEEMGLGEPSPREYTQHSPNLKPHVLRWLEDNVDDRVDDECNKGWCIGSTRYRGTDSLGMDIFFHRKRDAMAFIKEFSKWRKPVFYCQYFTDVRKKLNLETLKYETVGD